MREIKFRAWASYGEMLPNVQNHIKGDWAFGNMLMKPDEFTIMQYTGMKDKNGVELYEGDIYRNWGEVFLCELDTTMYRKLECTLMDGDFEIIGNIYENPELLEEE